jgi:hypothetical protein
MPKCPNASMSLNMYQLTCGRWPFHVYSITDALNFMFNTCELSVSFSLPYHYHCHLFRAMPSMIPEEDHDKDSDVLTVLRSVPLLVNSMG